MNIYEKILAIMKDVQYLAKDDHVKFGQQDYKALSEEKVTATMRAELIKYSLAVFPIAQTATRNGNISHVDTKYSIVNVENPDEHIEVVSAGDGADTQDKGTGKAMTYAYKYMWLRTFAIPTGEDPDKISSAQLDVEEKKKSSAGNEAHQITLLKEIHRTGWSEAGALKYLREKYPDSAPETLSDITDEQFTHIIKALEKKPDAT